MDDPTEKHCRVQRMDTSIDSRWTVVKNIIEARRATRDFDAGDIAGEDLREILEAALLAPTSSNLQLFRLHVVESPEKRAAVAAACMNQRAARGARVLIAVAACPHESAMSVAEQAAAIDAIAATPSARQHARAHLRKIRALVRWAPLTVSMPWMRMALAALRCFRPTPDLPSGRRAFAEWAIRNSAFVAQTLMIAAQAKGYATCPMEGFDRFRVQSALGLAGEHVWLVIALGRGASGVPVDARYRRPFSTLVRTH